jgi:hypothetical protein
MKSERLPYRLLHACTRLVVPHTHIAIYRILDALFASSLFIIKASRLHHGVIVVFGLSLNNPNNLSKVEGGGFKFGGT